MSFWQGFPQLSRGRDGTAFTNHLWDPLGGASPPPPELMWPRPDNINALNCFSLGLFTCALRVTLNSNEFNILGPWGSGIFDASSWQCSKFQFGKVLGWNSTTSRSRRVITDDCVHDGWFCISSGILFPWRQTAYTSVVEQDLTTVPGVQSGHMSSLYGNPLQPSLGCRKLNLIWFALVSHFCTGYDFRPLNNRLDVFGITGFILSLSVAALEAALKTFWGLKHPITAISVVSTFLCLLFNAFIFNVNKNWICNYQFPVAASN